MLVGRQFVSSSSMLAIREFQYEMMLRIPCVPVASDCVEYYVLPSPSPTRIGRLVCPCIYIYIYV